MKPHIWLENGHWYCGRGRAWSFAYAGSSVVGAYAAWAYECITGPYLTMFRKFK